MESVNPMDRLADELGVPEELRGGPGAFEAAERERLRLIEVANSVLKDAGAAVLASFGLDPAQYVVAYDFEEASRDTQA